jgi:hypothetical protein
MTSSSGSEVSNLRPDVAGCHLATLIPRPHWRIRDERDDDPSVRYCSIKKLHVSRFVSFSEQSLVSFGIVRCAAVVLGRHTSADNRLCVRRFRRCASTGRLSHRFRSSFFVRPAAGRLDAFCVLHGRFLTLVDHSVHAFARSSCLN